MARDKSSLQNAETEVALGGSIFVNNTSYSGADIKIVVNIYDGSKSIDEKLKELREDLERDQKEINFARGAVVRAEDMLLAQKANTPGAYKSYQQLQTYEHYATSLESSIQATQEKIKVLVRDNPTVNTKVLAEVQTLSLSTHRDKTAVRACGTVYPKGFTRGPREIAGSLIFTVFNEHVLYQLLEAHASDFDANSYTSAIMDQLPPVDITIAFANEYGQVSRMGIMGVEFVDEGQVMSIEDIMTESVVSFVARDLDPMRAVSKRKLDQNSIMLNQTVPLTASDLILEEDYLSVKQRLSPYTRFNRRRNPFL